MAFQTRLSLLNPYVLVFQMIQNVDDAMSFVFTVILIKKFIQLNLIFHLMILKRDIKMCICKA